MQRTVCVLHSGIQIKCTTIYGQIEAFLSFITYIFLRGLGKNPQFSWATQVLVVRVFLTDELIRKTTNGPDYKHRQFYCSTWIFTCSMENAIGNNLELIETFRLLNIITAKNKGETVKKWRLIFKWSISLWTSSNPLRIYSHKFWIED